MAVSVKRFRQLALALPEAVEAPHFHLPSFRVRGKIFATLHEAERRAMLKLSLPDQSVALASLPGIAEPAGGWGKYGATFIALARVPAPAFQQLLRAAWAQAAPAALLPALAKEHP